MQPSILIMRFLSNLSIFIDSIIIIMYVTFFIRKKAMWLQSNKLQQAPRQPSNRPKFKENTFKTKKNSRVIRWHHKQPNSWRYSPTKGWKS